MENKILQFHKTILESKKICLLSHKNPDGDSLGSIFAIHEYLKSLNKNVDIFIDGKIPYNYKFIIPENTINYTYNDTDYDTTIILDCGDIQRLGKFKNILNKSKTSVCIDHHVTNTEFADINLIDDKISSTGELLYTIFINLKTNISKKIAEYLYISIITDTGRFTYSNTTSNTYTIAGELLNLGVDNEYINNMLYNSKPVNVVKTFIDCISNIEFYFSNKLGITAVTRDSLEKNNIHIDDIDGIVEFIREINEVKIACVLKEVSNNNIKVSLRSKNNIDVSKIAQKYNGGGHKYAAGFTINMNVNDAKLEIIKICSNFFGD